MKAAILTINLAILSLPTLLFAQETQTGTGLVPCNGPDCNACDVVALADNVIDFLVTSLGIIAVIMIVIAGFRLVTSGGNEESYKQAKEMFSNVVIGIIIILAAWLIVDTIMKTLVKNSDFGLWNDIQCVEAPASSGGGSGSSPDTNSTSPAPTNTPLPGTDNNEVIDV